MASTNTESTADTEGTKLVRIKPYDPKNGQKTRTHVIDGFRFQVERGWYRVEDVLADKLRIERVGGDANGKLMFDVMTDAQAIELQAEEQRQKDLAARADRPIVPEDLTRRVRDMTTRPERVGTPDLATKSATPITLDGADGDDDPDGQNENNETGGRVTAVGQVGGGSTKPRTRRG